MSIRIRSAGDVTLSGGDLSVDVIHTEDSVSLGDGTNTVSLQNVGGVHSIPVKVTSQPALTDGTARAKITDGADNVEIDDIGGEKALKVSVIASVGGGGGGTASTDSSTYTPTSNMFTPVGGAVDDASSDALAEGEMGMVRMTTARAMHVYIAGQAGGASGLTDTELRASAVPVSLASVPLGTGAATAANQTTVIGHLDGVETLLGTIDADTSNISTKIDTIAGAVTGTEMQVDVVTSALPTGAATAAHQVTQNGYLDGIEGLIGTTNTSLTTIAGHVDGLEGLLTTIDADTGNLGGILTSLQLIDDGVGEAGSATPAKGLMAMGTDGTNARTLKTDAQGELQVDISSSALPSGAATSALQTTGNTSLGTLAGAVSGSEMQVDVITLPAIPAGSNIIGKASIVDAAGDSCMDEANDSLKVSIVAGAGSGGTSIVDDAAFTAGTTTLTPVGGVYQATPDSVNDGDAGAFRMTADRVLMTELQNASVAVTGTFWQATQPVSGTVAVTGVATAANQTTVIGHLDGVETLLGTIDADTGSMLTSLQLLDDTVATDGAATPTKGILIAGQDGTNAQTIKTDSDGNLQVDVLTMPTVAVTGTFWQATQPVSGTFWQATQPVSGTVTANLAAGTNNIGDVDVLSLPALPAGTNNIGDVDVLTLPGIAGTVAHDSADSGNPVKIGGKGLSSWPNAAAHLDRVDAAFDIRGRFITHPVTQRENSYRGQVTLTNTTETTVLSAAGSGVFIDVFNIVLTNTSSTAVRVDIRDATGGTVRLSVALAANGGAVIPFASMPFCQVTANNNWTAQLSGSVTDVRVFMFGGLVV